MTTAYKKPSVCPFHHWLTAANRLGAPLAKPLAFLTQVNWICYALLVCSLMYFFCDRQTALYFYHYHQQLAWLTPLNHLGHSVIYIAIFGLLALTARYMKMRRPAAITRLHLPIQYEFVLAWLCCSTVVCSVLKLLLGRARPEQWLTYHQFGFFGPHLQDTFSSFPSGHTTAGVSLALGLGVLFPRYAGRILLIGLLYPVIRILLTHHYLSDVFGTAYLTLVEFVLFTRLLAYCARDRGVSP